jgi:hypothetical protein
MDVDETALQPETGSRGFGSRLEPSAWWESRTPDELREIIKRGFGGGETYDRAVAETERRAREAMRRMRAESDAVARREARKRMVTLAAAIAIFLGSMAWAVLKG